MGASLDTYPLEGHDTRVSDNPPLLRSASRRTTTSSGVLMSPSSESLSAGALETVLCRGSGA